MTLNDLQIREKIAEILRVQQEMVTDSVILKNLVAESFRLVEMVIELQEIFKIRLTQDDLRDVRTVQDLVGVLLSKINCSVT